MENLLIESYVKAEKSVFKLRCALLEAETRFYSQSLLNVSRYEDTGGKGFVVERDVVNYVDVTDKLRRRLKAREEQSKAFKTFVGGLPDEESYYLLSRYVSGEAEYDGRHERNISRKLRKFDRTRNGEAEPIKLKRRPDEMNLNHRIIKLEKEVRPHQPDIIVAWADRDGIYLVNGKPVSSRELNKHDHVIKVEWV